ncbi:hypothetical protein [Albibacillus kandeliae]|uniref:hypothetical protein n=1 Tax=Albibacillus kandeliae TaxID=2174228 RepID=UPI000D698C3A|nr:hypothetical protein [Albibacillus kandeliae]
MTQPDDLADWSLHCFCLGARKTPHALVRSGGNGRLLFEAADWCSLADLARVGISVSEDALTDLSAFNVLERRDGKVRSRIPRFGPDTIRPLRDRMNTAAGAFLDDAQDLLAELAQELAAKGLPHAFYAVFFGTVMDGFLWRHLRNRIDLPDTRLTADHPYWRGVFWAVYPPVENAIGTNEITLGAATLTMVWSEKTAAMLNDLRQQDWPAVFLRFLLGESAEPPPQAASAGLVDSDSNPTVPVFGSSGFAELSQLADHLADRAAAHLSDTLGKLSFANDLSGPARNVILAHEYIWAMQTVFGRESSATIGQIANTRPPVDVRGSVVVHIDPPRPPDPVGH